MNSNEQPHAAGSLTRGQVATRLAISPERVRQLTLAGRLPCTLTPLGRLYREADVQSLAEERRAQADRRQSAQVSARGAATS